jgi:hypothetical protein
MLISAGVLPTHLLIKDSPYVYINSIWGGNGYFINGNNTPGMTLIPIEAI